MAKVTMIQVPAEILDRHQSVAPKKITRRRLPLKVGFYKGYTAVRSLMDMEKILFSILAFLLGRVFIMDEFAPIGLAFFTAVAQVKPGWTLMVAFWTIAGVVSGSHYAEVSTYVLSIGLYFLWQDKLSYRYKKIVTVPIFMFCAVLCAGLIVSVCKELTIYNVLLALFESTICMVFSYIFIHGVLLLIRQPQSQQHLTSERLGCMVVLLSVAVAGLGNIMILEYSIRNLAGDILIMAMALAGGVGISASVGVVVGLIVGLSDGNATVAVSLYAFASVFAGAFKVLGKWAVIVGFILGSVITVLYSGQDSELMKVFRECIIAGGLFLLIPSRWLTLCYQNIYQTERQFLNSQFHCNEVVEKINNVSEIFNDLAETFGGIVTETKGKIHDDELARTLSVVGEQICENCAKRSQCWEVDFYRTYHGILEILGQPEVCLLTLDNMPGVFQENCIRCKELLEKIQFIAKHNYTTTFWQKKIVEHRQMVMEQMKATSEIISNLAYEIGKVEHSNQEFSLAFQEKSEMIGCPLTEVRMTGENGAGMIEILKKTCNGNRECINTILPLAAGLMKEKMILRSECGNESKTGKCKLTMLVAKRFSVDTGIASIAKDGQDICGDSCIVIELSRGKVALVLSDGMGSGSHAAAQSSMSIEVLKKLLIAGFDTDIAVKTVNSMLLLNTTEESFVTIDMVVVDTYSGNIEFLKIGSAPSFIKRVREVREIKSSSLPIGILQKIEIQTMKEVVVIGDFIVMVSDGIMDVPQNKLDKGHWLTNFLRQVENISPQALANKILTQAKVMSGQKVSDDMTVLVAKMIESPDSI